MAKVYLRVTDFFMFGYLGATSTTYTVTQTDTDKFLRVGVSYTDDYGTAETVYSVVSSLQVGNVNDAPSAGADQTGAITEDASTSTASGTVDASDQDPNTTLTYTASSTSGTYGSFAVTSSGVWTYTHWTILIQTHLD